jgi:hypothetical protein
MIRQTDDGGLYCTECMTELSMDNSLDASMIECECGKEKTTIRKAELFFLGFLIQS